jgi:uncharacterized protein YjbI with pentapeptide repeats
MADQEQLDILKQGVKVWNHWRGEQPDIRPDLSYAILSGAYLIGANLSYAILNGADLIGANLILAKLRGADLNGANLNGAKLNAADLNGANLSSAKLNAADLSYAILSGADLSYANLSSANFNAADLIGADLIGADLIGADLIGAKLRGADLIGADLTEANLNGADLNGANLNGADLTEADLNGANLNDAVVTGVKYLGRKHHQNTRKWKRFLTWLYPRSIMHGKYQGIHVASCSGNAIFKRDAEDQDFLDSLENQWAKTWRIWLFRAWGLIDYGRSLLAVFVIAFLIVVGFGAIYLIPGIISYGKDHNTLFSPFYFSIVTFTTLGFGDITPNGGIGEIIVSLQVIFGYLTLGLLISILANKVARRS